MLKLQLTLYKAGAKMHKLASKGVGTYNYTFKSVVFESVKVKIVKIKKILRSLRMVLKIICEKI